MASAAILYGARAIRPQGSEVRIAHPHGDFSLACGSVLEARQLALALRRQVEAVDTPVTRDGIVSALAACGVLVA